MTIAKATLIHQTQTQFFPSTAQEAFLSWIWNSKHLFITLICHRLFST